MWRSRELADEEVQFFARQFPQVRRYIDPVEQRHGGLPRVTSHPGCRPGKIAARRRAPTGRPGREAGATGRGRPRSARAHRVPWSRSPPPEAPPRPAAATRLASLSRGLCAEEPDVGRLAECRVRRLLADPSQRPPSRRGHRRRSGMQARSPGRIRRARRPPPVPAEAATAPRQTAARRSAPVFIRCSVSSSPLESSRPSARRSAACPPTMPRRAGGAHEGGNQVAVGARRPSPSRPCGLPAVERREGDQRQPRPYRGHLAVDRVRRRLTAPEGRIVHAGEVVVHERVRVDHLDARGHFIDPGREVGRGWRGSTGRPAARAEGGDAEDRPKPLATREKRVLRHGSEAR